ncbi:hypothetical protein [Streptomyces sp. NPDC086787]|uniref:hypothetical protein n=1 Tax=Streptomyces sp. NPDC086787 TaxID=3365759 RepID=UPI0037FDCC0B
MNVLPVSVEDRKDSGNCTTKQAKLQQVTVKLKHSLDDRVLLDASPACQFPTRG